MKILQSYVHAKIDWEKNIDKYTIIDGFNSQLSLIDMIGKISEIIEKSW